MTSTEVAQKINQTQSNIYWLLKNKKIAGKKNGSRWDIDPQSVDNWFKKKILYQISRNQSLNTMTNHWHI